MNNNIITYGKLYNRLRSFGFSQRALELNGKPIYVFQHDEKEKALIVLPNRNVDEPADRLDIGSVVTMLRVHDLMPSHDPLAS